MVRVDDIQTMYCRFAKPQNFPGDDNCGRHSHLDSLPLRSRMGGARVVGKDHDAEPLVRQ